MILFLYIVMCFIFGTTFLLIKLGLELGWSPFLFSSLRFLVAGITVILMLTLIKKKISFPLRLHGRMLYLSFLITTIPFSALYWGEQYISSGEAAVLVATSPLFILLIGHLKKMEQLSFIKVIGAIISMFGILVTVFHDINIHYNLESFLAKCFLIMGEAAFALGSIESKKTLGEMKNPFLFNGFQMLYGGAMIWLLSLVFNENYSIPSVSYGWSILVYFILFASIVSYGIFYWLIKRTNAYFSSTWTYVSPVIALALGFLIFQEKMGMAGFLGSILILGGVVISNIEMFKQKKVMNVEG